MVSQVHRRRSIGPATFLRRFNINDPILSLPSTLNIGFCEYNWYGLPKKKIKKKIYTSVWTMRLPQKIFTCCYRKKHFYSINIIYIQSTTLRRMDWSKATKHIFLPPLCECGHVFWFFACEHTTIYLSLHLFLASSSSFLTIFLITNSQAIFFLFQFWCKRQLLIVVVCYGLVLCFYVRVRFSSQHSYTLPNHLFYSQRGDFIVL